MTQAPPDNEALDAAILAAVTAGRSVSPSDVAVVLAGPGKAWQGLLPKIRARALVLMGEGKIEILRKGKPIADAADMRGVVRLRGVPLPP
ncbi:MAG: DUF3253 domain-containing protein [Magnetospirillum sp.]|nr:DUF3253 domain-containing protein [Magnetospirillum sp.]